MKEVEIYLSILIYFGTICFLPFFLWKSKKNTAFFLELPFCIIAYFLGGNYFIEFSQKYYGVNKTSQEFYAYLLLLGTVVYVAFYVIGFYHHGWVKCAILKNYKKISEINYVKMIRICRGIGILSIILFLLSFIGMGFIPMFAENPLMAKYMQGEYRAASQAYAIPYRLAVVFSNISLLVVILNFLHRKSKVDLLISTLIILFLILTLRRGAIGMAVLSIFMSYFSFKNKFKFVLFLGIYFCVFSFGSAINEIFYYFMAMQNELKIDSVLKGVPDVADQLFFVEKWLSENWEFTFGTNFFGGLLPYNSEYNLAVLTLKVAGNTVGESGGGGFRLPIPLVGYISGWWIGVVIITALNAYMSGVVLSCKKYILLNLDFLNFTIVNSLYFGGVISGFLALFRGIVIDDLVTLIVIWCVLFFSKMQIGRL